MPDFIGNIEVPEIAPSGTFPFATEYPSEIRRDYVREIHQMANTSANLKIEQRFLVGTGTRIFTFRRTDLNLTERETLVTFFEARKGSYQPFTYNAPSDDGLSTFQVTVRFAGPLTIAVQSGGGKYAAQCELIETPASGPSYTLNSTETRFPSAALEADLLEQDQELIPLVSIVVREPGYPEIFVSNRRCTVGTQLYQARLLNWDAISQALGGESDQAQFTFGNADRVMRDLAADTNLTKAAIEFSLFHVELGIRLIVWKGYVTGFGGDAADEFAITANDGIDLNILYPTRLCGRTCWKPYNDGLNCNPPGTLDPGFPAADISFCDHTYDGPNGCKAHDNELQFGGHIIVPQGVTIKDNSSGRWGMGRQLVNATSLVSDSIDGIPLAEIWGSQAIPVNCLIAATRDESDFRDTLGIIGAGPVTVSTNVLQHTLNGFPAHQVDRGSLRAYGIRLNAGDDPAGPGDWFQLTETSGPPAKPVFAAGTAFAEIRIADEPGIQPRRTTEDQMTVVVEGGLPGYQWMDATTRILSPGLNVPSWVVANMLFRAKAIFPADASTQAALLNLDSFMAAGAVCQSTVDTLVGTGTEIQFQLTCEMRTQKPLRDWFTDVATGCLGYWYFEAGKLAFGQRINSSALEAFTTGNIIHGSFEPQFVAPAYNELTVEFDEENPEMAADRSQAFIRRTIVVADYDHIDLYGKIPGFLTLNGVARRSQALRIGAITIREELGGINAAEWASKRSIRFRTTVLALATHVGMVCSLTHPDMPGGSGEFRISRWQLLPDMSLEIEGTTTTDSMYDLAIGPKPADVQPDPLPLERIEHFLPLQPWFPDQESPHADDPLWSETDRTFHVEQFYEQQADGSAGAALRIIGDHPTTHVLANVEPPRVGSLSTASTGGSLIAESYVVVCISAVDASGNETRVSKPMGVQCGLTGNTHKITLVNITWPAGTTGYRLYAALDVNLMCLQLADASQPSSIDVTSLPNIRTQGVPQENLFGLVARAQKCWHAGSIEATVTAVAANVITGSPGGWTAGEWVGYNLIILADATDGSAPPLVFAITGNDANSFTCTPDPQAAGVEAGDPFTILLKASSFSAATIGDGKLQLEVNGEVGRIAQIIQGMGKGQERLIVSNTATVLTVSPPWSQAPDITSHFIIVDASSPYEARSYRLTSEGETVELALSVPNLQGQTLYVEVATVDMLGREPAAPYHPWRLIGILGDIGSGGEGAVPPGPITDIVITEVSYADPALVVIKGNAALPVPYNNFDGCETWVGVPGEMPGPGGHHYHDPADTITRHQIFFELPRPDVDAIWRLWFVSRNASVMAALVLEPPDQTPYVDVNVTARPAAGTPPPPDNVTLGTPLGPRYLPPDAVGMRQARFTVPYLPPSPLGTFDRVFLWLQEEDDASKKARIGAVSGFTVKGTAQPLDDQISRMVDPVEPVSKGMIPYRADELILTYTHPAPAERRAWRLYACSGSLAVENTLVRADQPAPTPNVLVFVDPPPPYGSGEEFAPNAATFVQDGPTQYYPVAGGQWFWYVSFAWTNATYDPRYGLLGGYDIVLEFPDLAREEEAGLSANKLKHTLIDRPVYFEGTWVAFYLVAYDREGRRNTLIRDTDESTKLGLTPTPVVWIFIQRELGAPGEEYAPLVPDDATFTVTAGYEESVDNPDGQLVLVYYIRYSVPPDARFKGVVFYLATPGMTMPGNRVTGIEPATGELRSEQSIYPAQQESHAITLLSSDGISINSYNPDPPNASPTRSVTVYPPHLTTARVPNVTDFTVTYRYDPPDADYSGNRVLRLIPNFTRPGGTRFSRIAFWGDMPGYGWTNLGAPTVGGDADAAIWTELPVDAFDWSFCAIAMDVNGLNGDGSSESDPTAPPAGTPFTTCFINPPNIAAPLPDVVGFSVTAEYSPIEGDYYGKQELWLTPTFTLPTDRAWAYIEFWAYREDGKWYHLGNPAHGGAEDKAIVTALPEISYYWQFLAIANDINGKDRDGNTDSSPLAPPAGTPTATVLVQPPTGALDGSKVVNIPAASFAAGLKPVQLVTDPMPALPNAAYPPGTLVVNTSKTPPKLHRVNNAGNAWTAEVDGLDLIADTVTAAAIQAGAVATSELFAGEILVGQGGGKPTRFKVVDNVGTTIAFIGDDPGVPFVGGYFRNIRIAATINTASPKIEASGAGIALYDVGLDIVNAATNTRLRTGPNTFDASYSSLLLNMESASGQSTGHRSAQLTRGMITWYNGAITAAWVAKVGAEQYAFFNMIGASSKQIQLDGQTCIVRADGGFQVLGNVGYSPAAIAQIPATATLNVIGGIIISYS